VLHVAVGSDREVWAVIDDEKEPTSALKQSNIATWDGKAWIRIPGMSHDTQPRAAPLRPWANCCIVSTGSEQMKLVSCGADGTLWAINSERFTFRLDRESLKWEQMPGSFKQVRSTALNDPPASVHDART
jgi:hypothetical protein